MKVAVIGLGYWGPNLVRNLVALVGADNVVVADPLVDRQAAVVRQYPSVVACSSLDQVLADEQVGAVVVATPVSTHATLARAALEAGRHVLVEKPLAASSADGLALVQIAEANDLTLMVGHTFLFSPRVECAAKAVRSGELGTIQYATSSRLNLGLHQRDIGVIWDLAPHDFSILFHVLDEMPASVQTAGRSVTRADSLDVAFMTLAFPSGMIAAVSVSWLAPKKVRDTVFVGDQRMLVYDDLDNDEPIRIYDKGVDFDDPTDFGEHQLLYRHGDVVAPYVVPREPLALELHHFLDCIEHKRPCLSDGRFGLGVVAALEAAEVSWHLGGRSVEVAPPLPCLPGRPGEIDLDAVRAELGRGTW
jgi:predicted dehydrogenase